MSATSMSQTPSDDTSIQAPATPSQEEGGGARPAKRPLSAKQLENLAKGRAARDARREERKSVRAEENDKLKRLEDEEREVKRLKREALEKLIDERIETKNQLKQVIKAAAEPPKRKGKRARKEAESSDSSDSDESNSIQLPTGPKNLAPHARGPAVTTPSASGAPARRAPATTSSAAAHAKRQIVFL